MRLKVGGIIEVAEGAMMTGALSLEILHVLKSEGQVVCKWYSVYSSDWKYSCFPVATLNELKNKRMVTYG